MIPKHVRVAALDDNIEHLEKIIIGLGKAGFWAMPIRYDAGIFVPELPEPFPGIRLVFTDIHMGGVGATPSTHASNIINGLKKIVGDGPYGLIFWSQYPGDAPEVEEEIRNRATGSGISMPVFFGVIDKNSVMGAADNSDFDAETLRDEILACVQEVDALALAMSWDERVSHAASQVTNRLYHLAKPEGDFQAWTNLLAYLGQEAIGIDAAKLTPQLALDNAMIPMLEDRLGEYLKSNDSLGGSITKILDENPNGLSLPERVSPADLNTHYLIEEVDPKKSKMHHRGMVTKLGGAFVDSGLFVKYFGTSASELILSEFIKNKDKDRSKLNGTSLHLVELSAECDQVQGKVATHRYLLALLVPKSQIDACADLERGTRKPKKLLNDSLLNIGEIRLSYQAENHFLLISSRRFMTLGPNEIIDGSCVFRLRKMVIDELAHKYTSFATRPGVLRFK